MPPLISVCIPVYNTEPYLLQCLRSVIMQEFSDFEIVIVSDSSRGKDAEGRNAKKIIRLAQKEWDASRKSKKLPKAKINFIEHSENRGILEVRRTLCYEARGEYICFVDSDDELGSGALEAFVSQKGQGAYDIIQGRTTSGVFDKDGNFTPLEKNFYDKITIGTLTDHQIFHEYITGANLSGVLWGKLIRRTLLVDAFEKIPYTECNMAEDYLIFFFVTLAAKEYLGIESKVYRYRVTSGVSSSRKIDTLRKWKMICSTASVFTVIAQWMEENQEEANITKEETLCIRRRTAVYLANNLQQMKQTVVLELQQQARELLCEYWGEHFVETVENCR